MISKYLSLVKFSHTIFALPFAFIGFFLATKASPENFSWGKLLLVLLCMVLARSAAMAFNRYADRKIDSRNPRTAQREIPAGLIKPNSALALTIISSALFSLTTFFINDLCFYLSPVALLVILGYSYTKHYTFLCHLILGIGLSLAPIGAYLAVAGRFDWLPLFFSFAVLFWVSGFDIIYSLQDEEFDKSQALFSIPVRFGIPMALFISNILHSVSAFFIAIAGFYAGFGLWYWIGSAVFFILLFYQHSLVKANDLSKINLAFFTTNGVASVIFAAFVLLELLIS